ncbi:hypothetical protein SAMN05444141_1165 [Pseudovibrio denitrificans]|uniref:Uncharacterized protein n=1 Tax=Pseudovibrio denitrificans TaxID=258256 RepID=A0A1I7E049_9HYPH|nr:hypothetical protein SAMN05444141_1165 [Pseudovibrio denitrificans]
MFGSLLTSLELNLKVCANFLEPEVICIELSRGCVSDCDRVYGVDLNEGIAIFVAPDMFDGKADLLMRYPTIWSIALQYLKVLNYPAKWLDQSQGLRTLLVQRTEMSARSWRCLD